MPGRADNILRASSKSWWGISGRTEFTCHHWLRCRTCSRAVAVKRTRRRVTRREVPSVPLRHQRDDQPQGRPQIQPVPDEGQRGRPDRASRRDLGAGDQLLFLQGVVSARPSTADPRERALSESREENTTRLSGPNRGRRPHRHPIWQPKGSAEGSPRGSRSRAPSRIESQATDTDTTPDGCPSAFGR